MTRTIAPPPPEDTATATLKRQHHHLEWPGEESNVVERMAAPVATLASMVDPVPHWLMGCASLAGTAWELMKMPADRRVGAIMAGIGAGYFGAASLLSTGNEQAGYDLGLGTSVALTAVMAPPVARAGAVAAKGFNVTFASLGGLTSVYNLIKAVETHTGRPHDLQWVQGPHKHQARHHMRHEQRPEQR